MYQSLKRLSWFALGVLIAVAFYAGPIKALGAIALAVRLVQITKE